MGKQWFRDDHVTLPLISCSPVCDKRHDANGIKPVVPTKTAFGGTVIIIHHHRPNAINKKENKAENLRSAFETADLLDVQNNKWCYVSRLFDKVSWSEVVKNEDVVMTRLFFIYPRGTNPPSVNAARLKVPKVSSLKAYRNEEMEGWWNKLGL